MLYKLASMLPTNVLLAIFGIGLFVGIPAIMTLWAAGYRAVTFGLMYGMSGGIFKKIEDRPDNWFIDVVYFLLCLVLSVFGLLVYAVSPDLRVKARRNYTTWKIKIKKDPAEEKRFVNALGMSLSLYVDIYGPAGATLFVKNFLDDSIESDLMDAGEAPEITEALVEEDTAPLKIDLVSSRKHAEKSATMVTKHVSSRKKVAPKKK